MGSSVARGAWSVASAGAGRDATGAAGTRRWPVRSGACSCAGRSSVDSGDVPDGVDRRLDVADEDDVSPVSPAAPVRDGGGWDDGSRDEDPRDEDPGDVDSGDVDPWDDGCRNEGCALLAALDGSWLALGASFRDGVASPGGDVEAVVARWVGPAGRLGTSGRALPGAVALGVLAGEFVAEGAVGVPGASCEALSDPGRFVGDVVRLCSVGDVPVDAFVGVSVVGFVGVLIGVLVGVFVGLVAIDPAPVSAGGRVGDVGAAVRRGMAVPGGGGVADPSGVDEPDDEPDEA
ncbi:MAG: hypothetical protein ABI746_06335, partial [Dermatophilaceae bacterium]